MFADYFFNNSWDSNNDFNTEKLNQDIDAHAKLTNDTVQSLTSNNLKVINTAKNTITIDLGIISDLYTKTIEEFRTSIKSFSDKINSAALTFHNHYAGIKNTTYSANLNAASGDTRIDYDGTAVAFIDKMLEAFDELMDELSGLGIEFETESENLFQTMNEITDEYRQSVEKALSTAESTIADNGNTALSLITNANTTFKQKITYDFIGSLSDSFNDWLSSVGSNYGGTGLLGKLLDFGGLF